MSANEMNAKINELRELRRMADELATEIESIEDEIKKHMTDTNTDTLTGKDWKITWKEVTQNRFDTTAFKKKYDELYRAYTKASTSRRFLIS